MAKWDHEDLKNLGGIGGGGGGGPAPQRVYVELEPGVSGTTETEPMRVLLECVQLLAKKGADYQNPNSEVKQAMYYPNGIQTILDIIEGKRLRLISLLEAKSNPNFESIEDSFKDLVNYAAIGAAWCRGKIDGQDPEKDLFNKRKK